MDHANFGNWGKDGTRYANPRRVNLRLLYNGTKEDGESLQQLLQDTIVDFHPKVKIWKYKLQTCPESPKVGFIMYRSPNFQISDLVNDLLEVIKDEKGVSINIAT